MTTGSTGTIAGVYFCRWDYRGHLWRNQAVHIRIFVKCSPWMGGWMGGVSFTLAFYSTPCWTRCSAWLPPHGLCFTHPRFRSAILVLKNHSKLPSRSIKSARRISTKEDCSPIDNILCPGLCCRLRFGPLLTPPQTTSLKILANIVDALFDQYLATIFIQHSTSPHPSSLSSFQETRHHCHHG